MCIRKLEPKNRGLVTGEKCAKGYSNGFFYKNG